MIHPPYLQAVERSPKVLLPPAGKEAGAGLKAGEIAGAVPGPRCCELGQSKPPPLVSSSSPPGEPLIVAEVPDKLLLIVYLPVFDPLLTSLSALTLNFKTKVRFVRYFCLSLCLYFLYLCLFFSSVLTSSQV